MTAATAAPAQIDAIAEARALAPLLRENAAQGDHDARLPAATVQALRERGFFRLYVPRSLGGAEVDPLTYAEAQEELARHDAAAAWALQAAGSSAWWCSRLPDETVQEIYRDGPDHLIAVSFPVPMDATKDEAGFRLSGRRSFASNVSDASWVWVTATCPDESLGGAPVTRAAFFPASEVAVVRCWDTIGMRATDSNDVELQSAYVPERRTFRIGIDHSPGRRYEGPLYRCPAMLLVASYVPAVALGVARDALDEALALAKQKTPFSSASSLGERGAVQARLGRAEAGLRSARAYLHDRIRDGWHRTTEGADLSMEDRAELLLASVQAVAASAAAVETAFSVAGTTAVHRGSRLERHLRDIVTLKQQGFVSETRFETYAQVRLGQGPELGFVAL